MAKVETVRGAVDTSSLGTTLMHEHIFVLNEEVRQNWDRDWDEEARVAQAVAKMKVLESLGVTTIVDPTVVGLGRYIPRIQRVAEQTSVNIVAATGLYTYNDVPFAFRLRGPGTQLGGEDPMIELFVRDIREGIGNTGVKAAFLKCAIDEPGLTPGVERVLRAVGQAQVQTNVPVTVHTHPGTRTGLIAQRILAEEGVDLSRVVIGHSGDSADLDYLSELMAAGSFIGMDRFGIELNLPFTQRVETVAELCRRGHADQMVLAHDASCYIDWFPEELVAAVLPQWQWRHIHDDVLPALSEQGVTDQQISTMLVDNPRRYFDPS